ncbi:aldehyde dehydrogenase family protein, partial [Planococcus sp. SIMBA_143]
MNTLQIYDFDKESLTEVVQRSQKAFEHFRKNSSYDRTEILLKAASLLESHSDTMAEIISLHAKKPIKAARQEVGRCIQTLKLSGIEASKLEGESLNLDVAPNGSNRE